MGIGPALGQAAPAHPRGVAPRHFASSPQDDLGGAATRRPDFDGARGHGYVRFSVVGAHADIEEAVARMGDWLK